MIGAVQRVSEPSDIVVCAAGGLPGELHKLWNAAQPGGYHLEYGYSCMGYEIAGGLGVKMARPDREVIVMVGDGSYLMMNSEIATSVMLGLKLIIVVLDNRGFGCINRLQRATGGESFNNLFEHARHETLPEIDFAAHAASLGAVASKVVALPELEAALKQAREAERTSVIVIDTDPARLHRRRRALVGCGSAGGLGARGSSRGARGLRGRAESPAAGRLMVRIGANPIGWSNDDMRELGGATPLEVCLAEAKEAGFEGMELGHKFPREPKALAAVLGSFGLALVSGWYSAELLRRDADEEMNASAAASRSAQGARLQCAGVRRNIECDPWRPEQAARPAPHARRRGLGTIRQAHDRSRRPHAPRRRAPRLPPSHGHGGGERRRRSTR